MNYKLEKFWNTIGKLLADGIRKWTINLKSFEISGIYTINEARKKWTINLKSFEIPLHQNI